MVPLYAEVRWCPSCRAIYRADFARCPNDGAALERTAEDPLIGATLGHYVVDAFLGQGAMARVYRAHHARLAHKQVAIKVLIGDYAATLEMRLRFAQEADAASKLDHPNVVSVVDFGKSDTGLMFLVMELVDGASLADAIADAGTLPLSRALAITRQILLGLQHAHERGLVHRDLKPDNVVVAGELARIVDFGLAIPVDDEQSTRLTGTGLALGTPVYASPEQTHGEPVDHRADLFAVGISLFEMLTGDAPYGGSVLEVIHHNASDKLPALSAPADVVAFVTKLCRRDPALRYASAREALAALDGIGKSAPVMLPDAPRRSRWRWALVAAALAGGAYAAFAMLNKPKAVAAEVPKVASAPVPLPVPVPVPAASPPPPPSVVVIAPPPVAPKPKLVVKARAIAKPAPVVEAPIVEATPAAPEPVATAPVELPHEPVPAPPPPPVVAPPPKPVPTTARVSVASLGVRGSLANDDVRRAVDRLLPAVAACYTRGAPASTVRVTLSIDESRRASNVHASGPMGTCTAAALDALRVTSAPDVGGVSVTVELAFQPVST